jgi:hypothetical protein
VSGVAVAWVVLTASLILCPVGPAAAAAPVQINVPSDQPTIQAAIDIAAAGDTVVVASGIFHERIDFKGKAIEVRSSGGPLSTTIDGDDLGEVVRFHTDEGRGSILRGFTITGGVRHFSIFGAGVHIDTASPTIVGNVITGNYIATSAGAGIAAHGGAALIQDNHIFGNHSAPTGAAGGIYADGNAEIVGNLIEDNVAGGGGGVLIADEVLLADNVIRDNHALTHHGGGVSIGSGNPIVAQNLISKNTASARGGGLYRGNFGRDGADRLPVVANNTIVGNQAPEGSAIGGEDVGVIFGNNVVVGPSGSSTVQCFGTAGQLMDFHHNNVYRSGPPPFVGCPDPTGTSGNISADPRLVDPDGVTPDYRLQRGSPSIDAGLSFAVHFDLDIDGLPRETDGDGDGTVVVDMGAYEAPTVVRRVSQIPYSVWTQPTGMTLDSIGSWFYPVNEPTAGDGQLPPAWFYAHYFGFEGGGGKGQVGLVTNPDGKFAVFSMVKPDGTTLDASVPFDWSAGQYYFPFVFPAGPGAWAAWIYDDTAGTWTEIGTHTVPPDWGRLAPASITAVSWLGPVAGDCAAYPHADVAFYAPFGFIGGVASEGTATTTAVGAGDCVPVADVQEPWARYQVGA